jgi:putative photosynthetic complex assembly protein
MNPASTNTHTNRGIAALGIAVLASVFAVAVAKINGYAPAAPENGPVVASCRLGFEDVKSGDALSGRVLVYDWDTGQTLAELAPGEGSFIRGVLRSMVRERRSRGLDAYDPFSITRFRNGSLTLQDNLTGRRIELQAFGPSNAGAFARLLDASRETG